MTTSTFEQRLHVCSVIAYGSREQLEGALQERTSSLLWDDLNMLELIQCLKALVELEIDQERG